MSHGFMTHSGNKQDLEPFMQLVFIKLYNRNAQAEERVISTHYLCIL